MAQGFVLSSITITADLSGERWASFAGYNNLQVSEEGRVRFTRNGRLSLGGKHAGGYRYVSLNGRSGPKQLVHRLVALAFVSGRSESRDEVNHKNGLKIDNRASNLEWVTIQENVLHGWATGLLRCSRAKIDGNEAQSIIDEYVSGDFTYRELAARHRLKLSGVRSIVWGTTWPALSRPSPEVLRHISFKNQCRQRAQ